ncbi:MAG: MBL fold metallo-hydrolase [Hydrogenothermaceae bacterium]|nr:MBL fold metallo-hydrolase [Hydrogenothermaceae bacterium]
MRVKKVTVGFIQENCYIIYDEESKDAVIVDPGAEGDEILEALNGLNLRAILGTHGHIDHVGQVGYIKSLFKVPFYLSNRDKFLLKEELFPSFSKALGTYPCPEPDYDLDGIDRIQVGSIHLQVIKTPGHTPGGVSFYSKEDNFVLVGDTLFSGSIGRTDLPGGDPFQLSQSLKRLMELPDDTIVYSGHGPNSRIDKERLTNPFITGRFQIR